MNITLDSNSVAAILLICASIAFSAFSLGRAWIATTALKQK